MTDSFDRKIEYLRLSVTDKCNLRCKYCMPPNGVACLEHSDILTFEEIERIVSILAKTGLKKIRFTGGEPFVRKDVIKLIERISQTDGITETAVTTNGILLENYIGDLSRIRLKSINISLDTADREQYRQITGLDKFDAVISAIKSAVNRGFDVKINCVPFFEEQNYTDMAELAVKYPVSVRYIELMPIGQGKYFTGVSSDEILNKLENKYGKAEKIDFLQKYKGPAEYYKFNNMIGSIGFISPISQNFCSKCSRIRLTCDGLLKLCLHYDIGLDIKNLLRTGADDKTIEEKIKGALLEKPKEHSFGSRTENAERRKMIQIGG
ncbi:MAG: GTP 3',8-cyclase MoaA [Firmicutes bacterium]|nr:GTP 3',8-cyclase MoaA [Bacillota bacterium]MBQ9518326.1 GTP 3',8-cyclase MoaA [Bacillota bacterium]